MSIRLSKNLWHFSVIVSFKVIFYFQNYQNTPDMTSQRVSCVVGKLLCAHGKHRVFSKNRINTEVKRRILSCWDIGPDFSEWLSPLRPQVGFCLQSVMAFHSLHRIPPLTGQTEKTVSLQYTIVYYVALVANKVQSCPVQT